MNEKKILLLFIIIGTFFLFSCTEMFENIQYESGYRDNSGNYGTIIVESGAVTGAADLYTSYKFLELSSKAKNTQTRSQINQANSDKSTYFIYLNGEYVGQNYKKISYLNPGIYNVKVINKFTRDVTLSERVEVNAGQKVRVKY